MWALTGTQFVIVRSAGAWQSRARSSVPCPDEIAGLRSHWTLYKIGGHGRTHAYWVAFAEQDFSNVPGRNPTSIKSLPHFMFNSGTSSPASVKCTKSSRNDISNETRYVQGDGCACGCKRGADGPVRSDLSMSIHANLPGRPQRRTLRVGAPEPDGGATKFAVTLTFTAPAGSIDGS